MTSFREYTQQDKGLQFIFENLNFNTSVGRNKLLKMEFITQTDLLQKELDMTERMVSIVSNENNAPFIKRLYSSLKESNDIGRTIKNLSKQQVLDDIELFEIKKFALLSQEIRLAIQGINFTELLCHDLSEVIDYLDPDKNRLPHFYIYSSYNPELDSLRKKISSCSDKEQTEQYRWESLKLEDEIRKELSLKLYSYTNLLEENLEIVAQLDLLLAKVSLIESLQLSKPKISNEKTEYIGLFNPLIRSILEKKSEKYQPVDLVLYPTPCLITGANMSGKTVILKTVALSQYLFQFGFYVPAQKASIFLVDKVMTSIGDEHSELNGLSSFAHEILKIDNMIKEVKKGKKLLILIDELARTTNPDEGKALVSAFILLMKKYYICSLITTHYGGFTLPVRKLRVKGLDIQANKEHITPENLTQYMDYALIENESGDLPAEALTIAEIFNVDKEFLNLAQQAKNA